jgi:hypothetical protein
MSPQINKKNSLKIKKNFLLWKKKKFFFRKKNPLQKNEKNIIYYYFLKYFRINFYLFIIIIKTIEN